MCVEKSGREILLFPNFFPLWFRNLEPFGEMIPEIGKANLCGGKSGSGFYTAFQKY